MKNVLRLTEPLPDYARLTKQLEEAESRVAEIRSERAAIVDAEARKVATYKVGEEFTDSRGRRFRIGSVTGEAIGIGITIFVRYKGGQLYKNGNTGKLRTLFPPTKENAEDEEG